MSDDGNDGMAAAPQRRPLTAAERFIDRYLGEDAGDGVQGLAAEVRGVRTLWHDFPDWFQRRVRRRYSVVAQGDGGEPLVDLL